MAGALTRQSGKVGEALVRQVARRIVEDAPKLQDLGPEELRKLARIVVAESLKDDLRREADRARVDYQAERERFLKTAASPHTRLAYAAGLALLEAEAARLGVSVLALTPAQADDWTTALSGNGAAPATVRLRVAAASAFYTWLERRHSTIRNPFRGSRARPKSKPRRTLAVPSPEEIATIREAADPTMRAAVAFMADLGLRVGALPEIVVRGGRYVATSKGKDLAGDVPETVLAVVRAAGLPLSAPFGGETAGTLADRFRYMTSKLHREGKLSARFSVHDLRHAFAVRHYTAGHDVYATSKALGHAGVGVTERYLKSLGLGEGGTR